MRERLPLPPLTTALHLRPRFMHLLCCEFYPMHVVVWLQAQPPATQLWSARRGGLCVRC